MTAFYPNGAPIIVPSTSPVSIGVGVGALADCTTGTCNTVVGCSAGDQITTGSNNLILGPNVATTTLSTGSNNIIIGTSATQDTASAATSNTFLLGAGSTAIMSATNTASTPAVTIPGTLTVTGTLTASGGGTFTGVGTSVGGVATGSYSQASSTTLSTITGLSASLAVGTYAFNGYLSCSAAATPGIKLAFAATNGLAASEYLSDTWVYSATTLTGEANLSSATLTSNIFAAAVAATAVDFSGSITVSTAGTITLQAAQNVSNTTALTIANGSFLVFTRLA